MVESTAVEWIAKISSGVQEQTHPIKTAGDAQRFVDEVVALIGEPRIPVAVITREQADALGHQSPDWKGERLAQEAFSVEGRRTIYIVDAGQTTLVWGLLLFHEVAHVLQPTLDSPHGPEFVRAWLDLMRRSPLYGITADSIEATCRLVGVPISPAPSSLAVPPPKPRRRGSHH